MTESREADTTGAELRCYRELFEYLENPVSSSVDRVEDVCDVMSAPMGAACRHLGFQYAVLFAGTRENEMVLRTVAWAGLPPSVGKDPPHFNWLKAGLFKPVTTRLDISNIG